MKNKIKTLIFGFGILGLSNLFMSCGIGEKLPLPSLSSQPTVQPSEDNNSSVIELSQQEKIYQLAKASGYSGSYEEWLDSIKGDEVEISIINNAIQWKYVSSDEWNMLLDLNSLKGEDGKDGEDGLTPFIGSNGNWWIGDNDTGISATGGESVVIPENEKFSVTFHYQDGTTKQIEVEKGNTIDEELVEEIKGYTFNGWEYENTGKMWEFSFYPVTKDMNLYASFEKINYNIILNLNGGYCGVSSLNVSYGEEYQLPLPEKIGCSFMGWYMEDNLMETSGHYYYEKDIILTAKWEREIFEDPDHYYHVVGNNEYKYNDNWTNNEWGAYEHNKLTPISLNEVKDLDADLYNKLAEKDIKYLYSTEIRLGVNETGWTNKSLINGKVYVQDGSYSFKIISSHYEETDGFYVTEKWMPDPYTTHVESLTPETLFIPQWAETKDEFGFSWVDNPVCIGQGGVYTVVFAAYDNESAAQQAGAGFGLILKEIHPNALPHIEYSENENFSIIGSMSSWSEDYLQLSKTGEGFYETSFTINAGDSFVIRTNNSWEKTFGSEYVTNKEELEGLFGFDESNHITCLHGGTYYITFNLYALEIYIYQA